MGEEVDERAGCVLDRRDDTGADLVRLRVIPSFAHTRVRLARLRERASEHRGRSFDDVSQRFAASIATWAASGSPRTRLLQTLVAAAPVLHHRPVEPEPLISRPELTGMLFAIADLNANVRQIRDLLEEEFGGEEEAQEDDS